VRRATVGAIAAAAALAGCPLPQPLPSYPAGTVTPPRILASSATSGSQSLLTVPAGCATAPTYDLDATIFNQTSETVEARWFVDYRPDVASRYVVQNTIREVPADPDPLVQTRQVPTFTFRPYGFPPAQELNAGPSGSAAGVVHVVELVVSNGFDTSPTAPEPNRTPATTPDGNAQFEIQTYRWVFVNVAGLACP
jgi:hypothetical protein